MVNIKERAKLLEAKLEMVKLRSILKSHHLVVEHLKCDNYELQLCLDKWYLLANKYRIERDNVLKFHQGITKIVSCAMCNNSCVFHFVYGIKGTCVICKEETDKIFSTTCGHTYCEDCKECSLTELP